MLCKTSPFTFVASKGEPGYVIAGTDSNFVPGRKGEPGSSVSFKESVWCWVMLSSSNLISWSCSGPAGTTWGTGSEWITWPPRPARPARITRNICEGRSSLFLFVLSLPTDVLRNKLNNLGEMEIFLVRWSSCAAFIFVLCREILELREPK